VNQIAYAGVSGLITRKGRSAKLNVKDNPAFVYKHGNIGYPPDLYLLTDQDENSKTYVSAIF
jgi:hypothetical protein